MSLKDFALCNGRYSKDNEITKNQYWKQFVDKSWFELYIFKECNAGICANNPFQKEGENCYEKGINYCPRCISIEIVEIVIKAFGHFYPIVLDYLSLNDALQKPRA
jgi:hypothetical protein